VSGHRALLATASPVFRQLFATSGCGDDDVTRVSLPDFSRADVETFVESVYIGSVPVDADAFIGWKTLVGHSFELEY
jgi:hypothetical protein